MIRHSCYRNDFIFEGGCRGLLNFEVATSNVEDGSVDFGDPVFIAQLILLIDTMGPLLHKKYIQNTICPVVVWKFLTDVLTGVEGSCLGISLGAYAAGEPQHGCQL